MVDTLLNLNNSQQSSFLDEGESFYLHEGVKIPNLADDNGYAYHKTAVWVHKGDGKPYIKTRCEASRTQMGRVNVSASSSSSADLFDLDGIFYTVGEAVPEPEKIRKKGYARSEINNVLVSNAIHKTGLSNTPVRLSTGLPLKQYFFEDGSINVSFIEEVKSSLQPLAKLVDSDDKTIINEHIVYAESLSAFVDWFVNDEGEIANEVKNGVTVVDVGGGTTDISNINAKNQVYMPNSDTKQIGILDVFKKLKSLISVELKIDEEFIRDDMLDSALRTNLFNVRGREHDVSALVIQSKETVAARLKNFVNELIDDTVDKIIFVGGGAEVLRDQLISTDDYEDGFVHVPNEPQFANVRGMLKLMTFVNTQEV